MQDFWNKHSNFLKNKTKQNGRMALPDFNLLVKLQKSIDYWLKDTHIDQQNRIESQK